MRWILTLFGLLLVLLDLSASFVPGGFNWGFHHLAFFSLPVRIVLCVLMVSFLLPPVQSYSFHRLTTIADHLSGLKDTTRVVALMMSGIFMGMLFWVGRQRAFFLGDGYLVLRNLGGIAVTQGIPGAFPKSPLLGLIEWTLYRILEALDLRPADVYAVQFTSLVFGAGCVFLVWHLSKHFSSEVVQRILVTLFVLVSGAIQFFFGYVENYTAPLFAYILYLFLATKYLSGNSHIVFVAMSFGLLVAMHVGMLFIVPSFLFVVYIGYKRDGLRTLLQSLLIVVLTTGFLLWLSGYTLLSFLYRIFMQDSSHLVPWFTIAADHQAYTVFQSAHFIDLANLWLLLSPFTPIVLILLLLIQRTRAFRETPETAFLLINALCGLAFIFLCNADIGMARDWDVFSLFGFGAVILAAHVWIRQPGKGSDKHCLFVMMIALTFFHTAPWILINSSEQLSRSRFQMVLDPRFFSKKALSYAYEELAIFHRERKQFQEAAFYYEKYLEIYPGRHRIVQNLKRVHDSLDVDSGKNYIYDQDSVRIPGNRTARDSTPSSDPDRRIHK